MGTEAAQRVDLRLHRDRLAEDHHLLRALNQLPAQRAVPLIARDDHLGLRIPEIVTQMMQNPPRVAHARSRHDEAGPGKVIDPPRFFRRGRHSHRRQVLRERLRLQERQRLIIKQLLMTGIDVGRLDRHRTVEKHRERRHLAFAKRPCQQRGQQLRPAHGKRRHQHLAFPRDRLLQDLDEFVDRLAEGSVIVVAIRGLEKDQVCLGKRLGVAQDQGAFRPQVARERDGTLRAVLFDEQLQAGRAQHVAGLDKPRPDARSHRDRIVIGHGFELPENPLNVLDRVERMDRRFVGPHLLPVDPLCVLSLDLGRVAQDQPGHLDRGRRGEDRTREAGEGQQRQAPRVIEVGVRQEHGVQPRLFRSQRTMVQLLGVRSALEQPAVDEDSGAPGLDEIGRAGDFSTGRSENSDFHER